jgi:Transglycosylase-like domain
MRTRIALVAIIPVASIIVTIAALLVASSSARAASPVSTPLATPAPSASTTTPAPTTTGPPTPTPGTTAGSTPSPTVPPFPGLRPISPVLTETNLLVNLNTALHNEAAFHQALMNETQFLAAMANEAQFHQALSNEALFYETLLQESDVSSSSSAGNAMTAMDLPYTTTGSGDTVTPSERAAWERVAVCEEGGNWSADNGRFSGGLGITRTNWIAYGGGAYAPEGAMATEDEQIMVAEHIQASAPDQYGCHGW